MTVLYPNLCYNEVCFKGTALIKFGSHNMIMLYPNLCYNEVCYKGTALYLQSAKAQMRQTVWMPRLVGVLAGCLTIQTVSK